MTDSKKPDVEEQGVADFQASLVKKLQNDLTASRQTQDDITRGSRLYWQRVQAVHDVVLHLLEAETLEMGLALVDSDVARLLGLEATALFMNRVADAVLDHRHSLIPSIPSAFTGALLQRDSFLVQEMALIEMLFPREAGVVGEVLVLPLQAGGAQGLLALAARGAGFFEETAREPYVFLARALARRVVAWLKNLKR